jgi:hypothetical protein
MYNLNLNFPDTIPGYRWFNNSRMVVHHYSITFRSTSQQMHCSRKPEKDARFLRRRRRQRLVLISHQGMTDPIWSLAISFSEQRHCWHQYSEVATAMLTECCAPHRENYCAQDRITIDSDIASIRVGKNLSNVMSPT